MMNSPPVGKNDARVKSRSECQSRLYKIAHWAPAFQRQISGTRVPESLSTITRMKRRHYGVPASLLIWGLSCKTTFNKELCTSSFPLYSIKPNLRNLFMKKLTRDRVVPIISASVSD